MLRSLGAYFATLVGDLRTKPPWVNPPLNYVYHVATFGYFFIAFTIFPG